MARQLDSVSGPRDAAMASSSNLVPSLRPAHPRCTYWPGQSPSSQHRAVIGEHEPSLPRRGTPHSHFRMSSSGCTSGRIFGTA